MLHINGKVLFRAIELCARVSAVQERHEKTAEGRKLIATKMYGHTDRPPLLTSVKELHSLVSLVGMPLSEITAGQLIKYMRQKDFTFKEFGDSINSLQDRMRDELSLTYLLVVEGDKARGYFEPKVPLFGVEVETKFPLAAFEISEAGRCYALDRSTAAVFHLMRLMEIGIRGAARCLAIPDPVKPAERNWGAILRAFKTEFDERNRTLAKRWNVAGDKDLFDEVYVSLDAVRNVWRNSTMHVDSKYISEEAEHIFISVRAFMKKLASRMDEQGQPLA
jgi:hypothetical protein